MFEEIDNSLVKSQIRDAFLQYIEGRISEEFCKANIQVVLDLAKKFNIPGSDKLDENEIFSELLEKEKAISVVDIISKKDRPPKWIENFDARSSEKDHVRSLFKQYQRVLVREGKSELASKLKKEVYQILDCTPEPKSGIGWRYKGLVFGKVQSGKTSNFIGLITKAIDTGYDFIIILAGISEDLRQQTQDRVDKYIFRRELKGIKYVSYNENSEASSKLNLINLTVSSRFINEKRKSGDFKLSEINRKGTSAGGPEILVIKKNAAVLKDVLRYLDSICDEGKGSDKKINSKTCLIIDDECDNASVLSESKAEYEKEEATKKTINFRIRAIINLFKRVTYVGYTATPENIVMQSLEDTEIKETIKYRDAELEFKVEENLTLFPDDFIQIIEPSEGYLGLNEFLSLDNKYISIIPSTDLPETKNDPYTLNDSLKEAFLNFIANIYVRKYSWKDEDNNSMLIHPSVLKSDQEDLKELIVDFRKSLVGDSLKGESKSKYFLTVKKQIQKHEPGDVYFKHYKEIINTLEIVTVHSGKTATALNFKIKKDRVIVGGNKLSRGFTVEGLTVSYFFRKSSRLDTLHQMARWFGYRNRSQELIKVYLTSEDKEYFEFMNTFDEDLKEQIDSMNFQEIDPASFGLSLIYNPVFLGFNSVTKRRMDLTDPNKMRHFEVDARFTRPITMRSLLNNRKVNEENRQKAYDWFLDLTKAEAPYSLKMNKKEASLQYEKSTDFSNGGKIYFENISVQKILSLYDQLELDESSKLAMKFVSSIRNSMDVDFNKWSVMVSRYKGPDYNDFEKPFFNLRTYGEPDENNCIYVSSVEDPTNLEEDIFDLIKDEQEFKRFIQNTPFRKRVIELNKLRKELKKPLLKVYFTKPNTPIKNNVLVDEAVLISFKFPAKGSVYVRKE
jgi:hypothetical protein